MSVAMHKYRGNMESASDCNRLACVWKREDCPWGAAAQKSYNYGKQDPSHSFWMRIWRGRNDNLIRGSLVQTEG